MEPVTERLIATIALAVVGGGGSWLSLDEIGKAKKSADALAIHYVPRLARCEAQFDAQRKICLDLLEAERENTAQWRAQCGGP